MRGSTFVLMRSRKYHTNSLLDRVKTLAGVEGISRLQGPYDMMVQIGPDSSSVISAIHDLPEVDGVEICSPRVT